MPPARGDHEARRRDVSEAVWRVLAQRGFGGLTLRAVAAEMDASTGLLVHYFPNKRALVGHALDVLFERTEARDRFEPPAEGLASLRSGLCDILPLTGDEPAMSRIWVGSWDVALSDPELGAEQARRYARSRDKLQVHVEAAQRRGELPAGADPSDVAATAQSFALGVVVQALLDPAAFPAERQVSLLDEFLAGLAAGAGTDG
ncbi:TetR/AcrR family transcriptional regulator [Longispora sp. NPDC051575]|uniref:TetR/AcrR family transcriptional regulator n=1 Tax=Longispora sp. NPDC051575 TaxID=3154943 RepID=UPI00343BEC6B